MHYGQVKNSEFLVDVDVDTCPAVAFRLHRVPRSEDARSKL